MSELARYQSQSEVSTGAAPAWPAGEVAGYQALAEWAVAAQAAHDVAETLVQTSFVPESFRGKAHEATAAILSGLEVGLSPMAALRSFDVIQGTAAPRAVTLRAIVQSKGHELQVIESTATRCKMAGRRKGDVRWQEVTWTLDRAKQLGLTGKANWKNQPQAMLVARCTSELARLIAADAILGIAYTSEELVDGVEMAAPTATAQRAPTRAVAQRKPKPQEPTPEPEFEAGSPEWAPRAQSGEERGEVSRFESAPSPDTPADEAPEPEVDMITDDQVKKLHTLYGLLYITDRDLKLAYAIDVVKHDLESSLQLTKREAGRVIDALQADIDASPPATPAPEPWGNQPEPPFEQGELAP